MFHRFSAALVAMGFTAAAHAATYTVPGDAATIQAAIDLTVNGDEVVVSPGTYVENIAFGGRLITVRSVDTSTPSLTVIQGSVNIFWGETASAVLDGFFITGGGSGLWISESSPTIRNCVFHACSLGDRAGAVHLQDSGPLTLTNCEFVENYVLSDLPSAGAVFVTGTSVTMVDCAFTGNIRADDVSQPQNVAGGAIAADVFGNELILVDCTFTDNLCDTGQASYQASAGGVAIPFNFGSVHVELTNCQFQGNRAVWNHNPPTWIASDVCVPQSVNAPLPPLIDGCSFLTPSIDNPAVILCGSGAIPILSNSAFCPGADIGPQSCYIDGGGNTIGACPTGSCCLGGSCLELTHVACWRSGGTFNATEDCAASPCPIIPPACPSDLDGSGDIGFSDLLLIIADWGPCP